jgi:hypothetical protein
MRKLISFFNKDTCNWSVSRINLIDNGAYSGRNKNVFSMYGKRRSMSAKLEADREEYCDQSCINITSLRQCSAKLRAPLQSRQ